MLFATTDALAISYCVASSFSSGGESTQLPSLSLDYISVCSGNQGGCVGDDESVIPFLQVNGTISDGCVTATECANSTCSPSQSDSCCLRGQPRIFKIETAVNLNGVQQMKEAIYNNGAAVLAYVDASGEDFEFYMSGVMECLPSETNIDHVVYIVGWGAATKDEPAYWIAVNSWGVSWGMEGTFQIEMGINSCGIEGTDLQLTPHLLTTCDLACSSDDVCLGGGCGHCDVVKSSKCI